MTGLVKAAVAACAVCFAALASGAEPPRVIAPVLQSLVDKQVIAGAVTLVVDKETTLALDSVGYASLGTKRPMRTDDLFWIASMSKPITAAALMMLVDEGKVRLSDSVETYLPEFKGQMVADGDGPPHPPAPDYRPRNHEPHQRPGAGGRPRVPECLRPQGLGRQVRRDAPRARTRHEVRVQQLRHHHGGTDHRSRRRHALRRLHAAPSVRTARDEGHDVLADRRASRATCKDGPAERRPAVARGDSPGQGGHAGIDRKARPRHERSRRPILGDMWHRANHLLCQPLR